MCGYVVVDTPTQFDDSVLALVEAAAGHGRTSSGEAPEEIQLRDKRRQIGREPRHGVSITRAQVLDFFRCKPITK